MKILFEDNDIIVCVKPTGVLSQSDNGGSKNMVDILKGHADCNIYPIHRLDRDIGGVMVFAKSKSAAAALSADIADKRFKKTYIAIAHNKPQSAVGEMHDLLFRDKSKNKTYIAKRKRKGVRDASLSYKLLDTFELDGQVFSKIQVNLHTGRTHQIRIQFASRKMPLMGDRKYGAGDKFKNIGLCSYRISFTHPVTKENMTFQAEPDFSFEK